MLAEAVMEAEVAAQIGAGHGERSPERTTWRNGYRPRRWDTRAGTIELRGDRRHHRTHPARDEPPETPELVSPATQPAQPPVIATEVVTPPPVPSAATPPPPAVLVVTPVPTPEADAGEADERDVLAPWVYYFPTKWVPDAAEWRESFRWQDPLPTIEPPLNWEHDTWRTPFPTFEGYRDRLFIRAYGYTYAELTPQHEADMRAIFRTHHELLPAWMKAAETLDSSEVSAFLVTSGRLGGCLSVHGHPVDAADTPFGRVRGTDRAEAA